MGHVWIVDDSESQYADLTPQACAYADYCVTCLRQLPARPCTDRQLTWMPDHPDRFSATQGRAVVLDLAEGPKWQRPSP